MLARCQRVGVALGFEGTKPDGFIDAVSGSQYKRQMDGFRAHRAQGNDLEGISKTGALELAPVGLQLFKLFEGLERDRFVASLPFVQRVGADSVLPSWRVTALSNSSCRTVNPDFRYGETRRTLVTAEFNKQPRLPIGYLLQGIANMQTGNAAR